MEFPNLGQNCSEPNCRQLDFLPVKCDACHKIFCNDHFHYDKHNCPEAYRKDNQVPVCPLCNTPVSVRKGVAPDLVIGQHMDNDCKQKKKVSNKCSLKGCKQRELIPVICEKCHKNYCIRHRLAEDHNCQAFNSAGQSISNAGAAGLSQISQSNKSNGPFKSVGKPQKTTLSSVGRDLDRERRERESARSYRGQRSESSAVQAFQAGLSEDEALARAMALSMSDSQLPNNQLSESEAAKLQQEEEDAALAMALQQEEQALGATTRQATTRRQTSREKSCCIS